MKKSSTNFVFSCRHGLFGLLLIAFAAAAISITPFVNRTRAQQAQKLSEHADVKRDPRIVYPESKKVEVVEEFFGTKVVDPYRWLEDETSPEVKAWVDAQNKVTFAYLGKIPFRAPLTDCGTLKLTLPRTEGRLRRRYERRSSDQPSRRGGGKDRWRHCLRQNATAEVGVAGQIRPPSPETSPPPDQSDTPRRTGVAS